MSDFNAVMERMRVASIGVSDEPEAPEVHATDYVLGRVGVPSRPRKALRDGLVHTKSIAVVDHWLGSGQWALALAGPVGVGKTVAAAHWLATLSADIPRSEDRFSQQWITAADLSVIEMFGEDFRSLKRTQYLVIDDVGVEFQGKSGAFTAKLDAVIDARYSRMIPTLITTNQNADSFRARFSERIIDRLRDGGTWAEFGGESMR